MKMIKNLCINHPEHDRPLVADIFYLETNLQKPLIIFCHGFKGFKDWGHWDMIAEYFASKGYVFLKFNFSHNGTTLTHPDQFDDLEAFSQNNYSKELSDLDTFISHVLHAEFELSEELAPQKIAVVGHSKGGAVAMLKAHQDRRINATVAWAPIYDIESRWPEPMRNAWQKSGIRYVENSRTGQLMPLDYQMVQDYLDHKDRLDIPKAIRNMVQPLLIIHGDEDEAINYEEGMMASLWNQEMTFETIAGAGHTFGGRHPMTDRILPLHSQLLVEKTHLFLQKVFST